jgi:hypothetical protein
MRSEYTLFWNILFYSKTTYFQKTNIRRFIMDG